jgi:holo-[acyl-carrier protein] synthase
VIGIDLLDVDRLERALERRPRLADRLFRPGELEYARSHPRPAMHLAARFAAKEAAVKALAGDVVPLRDVEIEGGGDEPPRLRLHGAAADAARRRTRELAAAVVSARRAT